MKSILSHALLFFYIYTVNFNFIPIGTRAFLGVIGLVWFLYELLFGKKAFFNNKYFIRFLILLFTIGFFSLYSVIYNNTEDFEFVRYPLSIIFVVFSSYFVVKCLYKLNYQLNFKSIAGLIVNVVLVQSIIGLLMFMFPDLYEFLTTLQRYSDSELDKMNEYNGFRIIGFGIMFFGAGIIGGYALILIAIKMKLYQYSTSQTIILSLKFLIIFIVGMMMARTTLFGAIIGIFLIFMPNNFKFTLSLIKKKILFLSTIIIVPLVVIVSIFVNNPEFSEIMAPLFEFAFEMFVNYFNEGQIQTQSTNGLQTMFVFPTVLDTYLIGDGYFLNPFGDGYYMHTDVGYLRLIYYFGILGTSIFFFMQYYTLSKAFQSLNISRAFYMFIFMYLCIINIKGFADILFFSLLFWMASLLKSIQNKSC